MIMVSAIPSQLLIGRGDVAVTAQSVQTGALRLRSSVAACG